MYEENLAKMETTIRGLSRKDTLNFCETCHTAMGCGRTHGINLYDTGVCDGCGQIGEVANCVIANRVYDLGLTILGYRKSGLPRIPRRLAVKRVG